MARGMIPPTAPLLLALYEPDIAQNAGAMFRTCACLGVDAAIIEPAGFRTGDSRFRRAGMDYLDAVSVDDSRFLGEVRSLARSGQRRLVLLTTKARGEHVGFRVSPGRRHSSSVGNRPASPLLVAQRRTPDCEFPSAPPLRSLNVGVAATIAMTEALRQLERLPEPGVPPRI